MGVLQAEQLANLSQLPCLSTAQLGAKKFSWPIANFNAQRSTGKRTYWPVQPLPPKQLAPASWLVEDERPMAASEGPSGMAPASQAALSAPRWFALMLRNMAARCCCAACC